MSKPVSPNNVNALITLQGGAGDHSQIVYLRFRGRLRSWVHDGAQMLGRAVAECRLDPWIFKLLLPWQLDWCS